MGVFATISMTCLVAVTSARLLSEPFYFSAMILIEDTAEDKFTDADLRAVEDMLWRNNMEAELSSYKTKTSLPYYNYVNGIELGILKKAFDDRLEYYKYEGLNYLQEFDMVIMLTGHIIADDNEKEVLSRTYYTEIGSVCGELSSGVVSVRGDKQDYVAIAHLIGHLLGAKDDGELQKYDIGNLWCRHNSGHIMNPRLPNFYSPQETPMFSECSIAAMEVLYYQAKVVHRERKCLLKKD